MPTSPPTPRRSNRLIPGTPPGHHPHDREIFRLAVPAFGALVAEPLFLLADAVIVGRLGTAALGGLGVAAQVLSSLVYLCVFLAYGTTSMVARRLGAGDTAGGLRQGVDGLWLAAGIGVVLALVCWPLAPAIVSALGASPAIAPPAVTYLRISLIGVPAMLVVLAGSGVLRGLQDTRTTLAVAVVGNAVNVALNVVLVFGLGLGIAGSAWGTVIAQVAAAAAYCLVIARAAGRQEVSMLPRAAGMRAGVGTGVPLLIRTLALQAVLVAATAVATRQGDASIAAHQVALRVWTLLAYALDAIAIAGQALVGRYLGAGDAAGARAATGRMIWWGTACGIAFGAVTLLARPALPAVFGADPDVAAGLLGAVVVLALLQPVAGVVFVLDGTLIGAGDQRYLAVAGIVTMLVFLAAAAVVVATGGGLVALWLAFSAWMAARFVTLTWRVAGDAWLVTGAVRGR